MSRSRQRGCHCGSGPSAGSSFERANTASRACSTVPSGCSTTSSSTRSTSPRPPVPCAARAPGGWPGPCRPLSKAACPHLQRSADAGRRGRVEVQADGPRELAVPSALPRSLAVARRGPHRRGRAGADELPDLRPHRRRRRQVAGARASALPRRPRSGARDGDPHSPYRHAALSAGRPEVDACAHRPWQCGAARRRSRLCLLRNCRRGARRIDGQSGGAWSRARAGRSTHPDRHARHHRAGRRCASLRWRAAVRATIRPGGGLSAVLCVDDRAFRRCLQDGRDFETAPTDNLRTLGLVEAIYASGGTRVEDR